MKRYAIVLLLAAACACAGCYRDPRDGDAGPRAQSPAGAARLEKASPSLRLSYDRDDRNRRIGVVVRTVTALTRDQYRGLAGHGVSVDTVTARAFTASMKLDGVPWLSGRPYVVYVELSKTLKPLK